MENVPTIATPSLFARWRDLVLPREHGSWSLALEPLAFGLLVAPSAAGACLALAMLAAFFARRPLRLAFGGARSDRRDEARRALAACVAAAAVFFLGALGLGGVAWLGFLLPVAAGGAIFLHFDLRNAGREEAAEVAGAAAFAFVPAAIATLAGWPAPAALALALVMCGRAVPTVMFVRASLRAAKTGVRRFASALVAAGVALATGAALALAGLAPRMAAGLLAVLAVRAVVVLLFLRPGLRARALGMMEAVLGAIFVLAAAVAWRA